tara:strand:- start:1477 stop:1851 length:375 start_codon:yes stop_codon:yes gene_type:complete
MDIKVAATILVAMYVISGLTKVASLGSSEAERLSRALGGLSLRSSTVLVFLAGVIELVGSYMILRGVWTTDKKMVDTGSMILAVFTVLATLIFYAFPFRYKPFLSNMTALAALLLLPKVCELAK